MFTLRRAGDRGHVDHGWLNTYHTFSFNTYYDENHMGFRSLRVINDDYMQPEKGFGTHSHRDMEIVTYVLSGALEHRDSMGNGSVIRPGLVQQMTAGTGIRHNEMNPSREEPVHFLQIWILPQEKGLTPSYEQKELDLLKRPGSLGLVASPDGRDGSVRIHQDASLYAAVLPGGMSLTVPVDAKRHLWIHLARGEIDLGDTVMFAGDGVAVSYENEVSFTGMEEAELLIFDLA
jgi:hypothetical protein